MTILYSLLSTVENQTQRLGYALGAALWQMGALVGCLAFAASIAVCVLYDRKIARKKKTIYTITEFARKEQGGF